MALPKPRPVETDVLVATFGLTVKQAGALRKLGLGSLKQALYHFPARYEDRRHFTKFAELEPGASATVRGTVSSVKETFWGGRRSVEVWLDLIDDNPTVRLRALWFGYNIFRGRKEDERVEVVLHGRVAAGKQGLYLAQPEHEFVYEGEEENFIHLNRIVPVYPLTEGVKQRLVRAAMHQLVEAGHARMKEFYEAPTDLMPLGEAIRAAHFPETWSRRDTAMQRIIYDEFFTMQCVLAQRRFTRKREKKTRTALTSEVAKMFLRGLPFQPTGAQHRVMQEIEHDLELPVPMNRLLQGDVGSGKTLVAVHAMLLAVARGQQAALMAPTEILAEQHYLNLRRWMEPLGVSVGLHTGSKKLSDRSPLDELPLKKSLFRGLGSMIVGTHALLYDSYLADQLGLVVIDEQHKFGVMQRLTLAKKGTHPDVLVMTATPIPRTMGLTLYGDLDVSVIDELPPGRSPIRTEVRSQAQLPKVWAFIKKEVAAGRQAYVVYPFVEESETIEAKAVQTEFVQLEPLLAPARLGLMHGRLKPKEKDAVMQAFRENKIQVLVSTSVIEVGVDVPNATIMVIENAERFGLAQLHQLRGRVGRGGGKSYCVLVGEPKSKESWRRLKVMEETTDGFVIAEEDLKIRGPGNIFGTEQSGLPPLRFGDLVRDSRLLTRARQEAEALVGRDLWLDSQPGLKAALSTGTWRARSLASVS